MAELSNTANLIATKRYFMEDENWESCIERVVNNVCFNEPDYIRNETYDVISNLKFLPGGRILRNAGRPRGSMFNCYVVPIGDSIKEIKKYLGDSFELWSEGGGVGTNLSSLRPYGDSVMGKGGFASGPVSFLTAGDGLAETIKSGGDRRAAAIAAMGISHPEIYKFINSKVVDGVISNYNLSVIVTNEFLDAVEADSSWDLKFHKKEYDTVQARGLWDLIVTNMVEHAEPGILNGSNLFKNNSYYFSPIISTNPCGEVPLEAYGVCCLGSLVLPKMIVNGRVQWKEMEAAIDLAVRFLDNVIDVNRYVLQENEIAAQKARRIGLGIMGLAEYFFAKRLRYGSPQALLETERLAKFIRDASYRASIKLASEKGSFPAFSSKEYCKASFVRNLPAKIRMDIKHHGIRNVTVNAIAPTGTISQIPEVTNSIEPVYALEYKRTDRIGERIISHPMLDEEVQGDFVVDSFGLKIEDHFEIQAAVQKYTDGAVSKTINLPKETTAEELSSLLLEYARDLKGVTVYRDGSKKGQVLERLDSCPDGSCEM